MGSARFETVIDFATRKVDVAIRCEGCRYVRNLTAEQLGDIFGLGTRLAQVRRRLVCSKCGHKGSRLAPIRGWRTEPRKVTGFGVYPLWGLGVLFLCRL